MLNVALIGAGRWGINILRTLEETKGVSIVKVATTEKETEDLLSSDTELDAVFVATPGSTHAEVAMPFIEKGIATYIEKPMTTSYKDAQIIEKSAKKSGALVFVGHIHLYNPAFLKARDLVKTTGDIKMMEFEGMAPGPVREDMSVLWDWGPHGISMAIDALGENPVRVQGWGGFINEKNGNIYDWVKAKVVFPGNEELLCSMSWASPEKRTKFTIIGSNDSAVMDDRADKKVILYTKEGVASYPRYSKDMSLKVELDTFLKEVRSGPKDASENYGGSIVVKTLAAIEESIELDGKIVKC